MPKIPKETKLEFSTTRDLSVQEVRRLGLVANSLGLEAAFDMGPADSMEDLLVRQARATMPSKAADFIGKEHFRVIGDDLSLPRRHTSRIFTNLAFPASFNRPIDPADIGLVVRSREAANMPPLEIVNLNSAYPSRRVRRHLKEFENRPSEHDSVIQVEGVIDFSQSEELAEKIGILGMYETFQSFGDKLSDMVSWYV